MIRALPATMTLILSLTVAGPAPTSAPQAPACVTAPRITPQSPTRAQLAADPSLRTGPCGYLMAAEPVRANATKAPAPLTAQDRDTAAVKAGVDVLALHSRPGSQRTIFLDVTGYTLVSSMWNGLAKGAPLTIGPYDTNRKPEALNAAEKTAVYAMWRSVVEDFAPFDVDVTTQEPSADVIVRDSETDQVYGVHAVIGHSEAAMAATCGACGGVSYVGTVRQVGVEPTPLIFTDLTTLDGYALADTVSHELGHALGLNHDGYQADEYMGTHMVWGPIMGMGGAMLTTWSDGNYAGATNHEDDLAIIGTYLPLLADDHDDDMSTAVTLTSGKRTLGQIGVGGDVDLFTFAARTATTITVTPTEAAMNVDLGVSLLDGTGTVIADARPGIGPKTLPTEKLFAATITRTLRPGTYFVRVYATGGKLWDPSTIYKGDMKHGVDEWVGGLAYSAYGIQGSYTLTATTR
jgi:hypothetical protein